MYLPADAALELGIIDFVGMPHIRPHTVYSIEPAPKKEYKSLDETTDETLEAVGAIKKTKKKTKKKATKKKVTKKKTTRRKR